MYLQFIIKSKNELPRALARDKDFLFSAALAKMYRALNSSAKATTVFYLVPGLKARGNKKNEQDVKAFFFNSPRF